MPIGPQLPPHLAKRKRHDGQDEDASDHSSDDSSSTHGGPKPPPTDDTSKKRRVMGPAAPPAPLDQRPDGDPDASDRDDSTSDDDDDYGPALPGATASAGPHKSVFDDPQQTPLATERPKPKHDEWMMMPPTQDGLAARMDPTKLKARGFNTGKSATGGKADGNDRAWFETPEEKRKRLQDEVMGVKPTASQQTEDDFQTRAQKARDAEKARNIQKHNDEHRSKSLYSQHKGSKPKQQEDDPSKRVFDYEKDMSAAPKINHAQKREMLNKASDFGSRFSKGSFL